ncbi:hypothetical protein L6654_40260 [Bradyrhizobium sp. WYCCWR 13023]|uniref:Lipoprotein n=1 Tax=Bradyrhizobium zhengyangense TaxID=2911009 RepID=A0A9X1RJG5_9BRAD|nr:hypothetical protein [Bradyrhizobium zhengyangense]MCG2632825.1 hypothetical protein [Bradyrhizobium zhengyangense]MCG2645626.1 hypothetical protein [Bradyrhizobium zhengyangense]MCG2673183.1 hypothetical protein [Bradyrhizobium zhengyangense]
MRGTFIAAIAVASLSCAATWNASSAASSVAAAGHSVQAGAEQTVTTHANTKKKTRRTTVERQPINWLNPQPEPPRPAGNKPIQGGNWLNPQPEPPRPDTAKKLH